MAELFKNVYNQDFFNSFTTHVKTVFPNFKTNSFISKIFDADWDDKELKQRMRHTTITLQKHLTNDFIKNANIIVKVIEELSKNGIKETSIEYMFFPDFIEVFGIEHYDASIVTFEKITQFTSCEFGVRPFIISYPDKMIPQMLEWSNHKHEAVRRLASEGCRPRLPWAMALPSLKKDPSAIIPILENLKDDVSETVRRSVANNLNDISKDNPNTVILLVKKWKGKTKESNWLTKHASRTLLKQGNPEIMTLFGFGSINNIQITDFKILTPKVTIGNYLEFSFQLKNTSKVSSKIRLEYGLYYQKANGTLSKKVFKISEKEYTQNSTTLITRKQPFKIITTRKFHIGKHQVSIIINGHELNKLDFELLS